MSETSLSTRSSLLRTPLKPCWLSHALRYLFLCYRLLLQTREGTQGSLACSSKVSPLKIPFFIDRNYTAIYQPTGRVAVCKNILYPVANSFIKSQLGSSRNLSDRLFCSPHAGKQSGFNTLFELKKRLLVMKIPMETKWKQKPTNKTNQTITHPPEWNCKYSPE